jgi:hypothetical protein
VKIFLSYAEEDNAAVTPIVTALKDEGHDIFDWQDPARRGRRYIRQIEESMKTADAFLALISPSYSNSDWCNRERESAIQREQEIQAIDADVIFVHVLELATVPKSDTGLLAGYDWRDFKTSEAAAASLRELAKVLGPAPSAPTSFRDRDHELDKVVRGLTSRGGPHFWLIIAPPQLGKTWFLGRIRADRTLSQPVRWTSRMIDVRDLPPSDRNNAAAILGRLFGRISALPTLESEELRSIAQEIVRTKRPYVCFLDSAELLDKHTVNLLRSCLSRIYQYVQDAARSDIRLALIVASRRDDAWLGVRPDPRLSMLPLTEFSADVVRQVLSDLATERDSDFSASDIRKYSLIVHNVTEGLPALLVPALRWIQKEEWLEIERLEEQELFKELAGPYVNEVLLTPASLFPDDRVSEEYSIQLLQRTCRILAPYRLFTQSHLRHYFDLDTEFRRALEDAQWSMSDLWTAISGTALLVRPGNEPWQQIPAAIRRLLFRYFYETDEDRAEAHDEARRFVKLWADSQAGTEQVVGLVECLWHEASALSMRRSAATSQRLRESAKKLSSTLRESSAYTLAELRDYAVQRMTADEEFQEAVGDPNGLFGELVDTVLEPEGNVA